MRPGTPQVCIHLSVLSHLCLDVQTDVNSKMSGRVKEKSLHIILCANKLDLNTSVKCGFPFALKKEITQGENEKLNSGLLENIRKKRGKFPDYYPLTQCIHILFPCAYIYVLVLVILVYDGNWNHYLVRCSL